MLFNENDINRGNNYQYNNYGGGSGPNNTEDVMTTGQWIGVIIVLAIPIINIIMYLFWAFSSTTNENLRNFCRASLILSVIGIFLGIFLGGCSAMF